MHGAHYKNDIAYDVANPNILTSQASEMATATLCRMQDYIRRRQGGGCK